MPGGAHVAKELVELEPPSGRAVRQRARHRLTPIGDRREAALALAGLTPDRVDARELVEDPGREPPPPRGLDHSRRLGAERFHAGPCERQTRAAELGQPGGLDEHRPRKCPDRPDAVLLLAVEVAPRECLGDETDARRRRPAGLVTDGDFARLDEPEGRCKLLDRHGFGFAHGQRHEVGFLPVPARGRVVHRPRLLDRLGQLVERCERDGGRPRDKRPQPGPQVVGHRQPAEEEQPQEGRPA
ncbi:MAG: hypothetical protein M3065_06310 [Actinomycetota bacterium]|nr:hypothetical protein [Actinomycetota bacterium]